MSSYCLNLCLTSTLERHIAIVVLQATVLHGVAAHIARISMDYMENVAEALAHARTVDTRCSFPILSSGWEMRLEMSQLEPELF